MKTEKETKKSKEKRRKYREKKKTKESRERNKENRCKNRTKTSEENRLFYLKYVAPYSFTTNSTQTLWLASLATIEEIPRLLRFSPLFCANGSVQLLEKPFKEIFFL